MLDVRRLDAVVCTTALEVKLLAELVAERRLRSYFESQAIIAKADLELERCRKKLEPVPEPCPSLPPPPNPFESIQANRASIGEILGAIAKQWSVDPDDIKSARRTVEITEPRHMVHLLCKILTLKSLPEIGRHVGPRDHTTVLHSITKFDWLRLELIAAIDKRESLWVWVQETYRRLKAVDPAQWDLRKASKRPITQTVPEGGDDEVLQTGSTPCLAGDDAAHA